MRVMAVFVFTIVFFDVAIQWEECLFGNDYAYHTSCSLSKKELQARKNLYKLLIKEERARGLGPLRHFYIPLGSFQKIA